MAVVRDEHALVLLHEVGEVVAHPQVVHLCWKSRGELRRERSGGCTPGLLLKWRERGQVIPNVPNEIGQVIPNVPNERGQVIPNVPNERARHISNVPADASLPTVFTQLEVGAVIMCTQNTIAGFPVRLYI